jgi:GNAT superfamily N-acetyltransferase
MAQALIREAKPEDALAIARVHVDSWRTSYRGIVPDGFLASLSYEDFEQRWRERLGCARDPRPPRYVAESPPSGRIVGFAAGGLRREPAYDEYPEYEGELFALYLLREHQREGIGRRLLGSVATGLAQGGSQRMITWVLARSPSRGFYEVVGGVLLGSEEIEIGGARLDEVAYSWADVRALSGFLAADSP